MSKQTTRILRPMSLRHGGAAVALGLSLLHGAPAFAQQAQEEDEVELDTLRIEDKTADVNPYTQQGSPYKARVSGDPRRVKPLAETPATIQVVTSTQIQESGETDLRDIVDGVPGVTVGTGENGNAFGDRFIIRGQEVRSDVFVDGLRDPGMTTRESFAVEQIEITKGPSASFGGRGTTGGSVNSITKQASSDYDFQRVDLGIGSDDYLRGTADANFRLSDNAAVRANLLYAYEAVPNRDPSDRKRWGASLSGAFQILPEVKLVLDYYHLTARDLPDLGSYVAPPVGTAGAVTRPAPWDDVPGYAQDQDFLNTDTDTFTARLTVDLGPGLKIINSTRYGETQNGYVLTGLRGGGYTEATDSYTALTLSSHQGWQDVRYFVNQYNLFADFTTGGLKHALIVGAEYSDHKVLNGVYTLTNSNAFNCRTAAGSGANNAYCLTVAGADRALVSGDINNLLGRQIAKGNWDSDWQVETLSAYVMDTIDVTPWLTLHGGLRMDKIDYSNTVQNATTLAQTPYGYEDTLWNGHAGVVLKPQEDAIVYFSWGTSKEINGGESDLGSSCSYGGVCVPADNPATPENEALAAGLGGAEKAQNLELGTKWDLFDHKLMIQAALFQLTKDNVFEASSIDSYSNLGSVNTGKFRVRGVELGLVGNITEKLSGQLAATVMDSEVLRSAQVIPATAPAGSTFAGHRLSNFANTQLSGQLRYQWSEPFSFGGTATYKGDRYAGQPDSPATYDWALGIDRFRIPAYWTFDAFAEYKLSSQFTARLNVNNLFNADYFLAGYQSGHFLYKGDDRRATLTLTGRF